MAMPPARAFTRFAKYTVVGVSTLAFDLVLLAGMTQFLSIPYYIATPIAFLIAVSINYALSRIHVFKGTDRAVHHGYFFFLIIAAVGAVAITAAVYLLVTYASMNYLIARIIVAGFVGMGNYLSNLHLNFKVAGKH